MRFFYIALAVLNLFTFQAQVAAQGTDDLTPEEFVDKFYNLYLRVREEQNTLCAKQRGALAVDCHADYDAFHRKFSETSTLQQLYMRATKAGNQTEIYKLWALFLQSRTEMLAMKDNLDRKYYHPTLSPNSSPKTQK